MFRIWPFQTFANSLLYTNDKRIGDPETKNNKKRNIISITKLFKKIYSNNQNQLPGILSYSVILGTPS